MGALKVCASSCRKPCQLAHNMLEIGQGEVLTAMGLDHMDLETRVQMQVYFQEKVMSATILTSK